MQVKYTFAYILFLVYSFAVFGQMIPIIKDRFSHTFAEALHIATVHALYGSNHVDKEIETATRNSAKSDHPVKHAENFEVHILSEQFSYTSAENNDCKYLTGRKTYFLKQVLISIQSPPPRLS
jgi:hypothetical protein